MADEPLFGPHVFKDDTLRVQFTYAATDGRFKMSDEDAARRDRWQARANAALDRYDAQHRKNSGPFIDAKEREIAERYARYLKGPVPPGGFVQKKPGEIRREAEKAVNGPYHKVRERFIQKVREREQRFVHRATGMPEKQPDRTGEQYRLELNRF